MFYETLDEVATRVPIIKTGPRKFVQVFKLFVPGLNTGDTVVINGTVSATNPCKYNVMFGCCINRTQFPNIWVANAVNVARPHVLNITPDMHHFPFAVVRFDKIKDGEAGDWWYHFICYSEASSSLWTNKHKMVIDPYGCLQAMIMR